MTKNQKKIALIDGYGFVFRAFHSLPPLTRPDGTPVGAVYGFTNMIIRLLANMDASHVAMVFDSGSKTFRNEIYPAYKANRPPCPEELIPQFSIVRQAAEALNLPILERVGFEADDLIATVAVQASAADFDVVIVSSDKDLMQLVDEKISMYDSMKNKNIGVAEVQEKFSVAPSQVLDVLSLMGDASDNVPGVRGIGPKIAAELINKYGNLEVLLENLHEIKQEKRRQMLIDGVEKAKLSKILITLRHDVPVSDDLDDYLLRNVDGAALVQFLQEQGFRALEGRVRKDFGLDNEEVSAAAVENAPKTNNFAQIKQNIVVDMADLAGFSASAQRNGQMVFDLILKKGEQEPQAVILSTAPENEDPKEIFYVKIKKNVNLQPQADLFTPQEPENAEDAKEGVKWEDLLVKLQPILVDESVVKIAYGAKEQMQYLMGFNGLENDSLEGGFDVEDIALMAYVLNSGENKNDLDVLVANNLNEDVLRNKFSEFCQQLEKNKEPEEFSDEAVKVQFYSLRNYCLFKLNKVLQQRIFDNKLNNIYFCFERPLIAVLAKMQQAGIAVNKLKLKELSQDFGLEIAKLSTEIYGLAGEEFNIGSPKQLGQILFERLGLESGKKSSKTGALSTGQGVLEDLDAKGHEIAGKVLTWRHFSKLKSTYADALQNAVSPQTGRIHSTFSNISTSTGRLSSNNPNLQNIPIRSEAGRKIRSAFVAKKGCKLIAADYSQIELRILAQIADIGALKQAFFDGKDIHAITAAQVFAVAENEVDKEMRRKAKAINFGIIYGISAFGLAKQLKIDRGAAASYIKNYFATYPGIEKYMQDYQSLAKDQGFVSTLMGRKCFITNINSKNPIMRGLAERLAINAPIQGSAADIIKKAMIDFDLALEKGGFKSKMILQVHDELLIEAPENEADVVAEILRDVMEKTVKLDVPLKVDVQIGDYWG